MKGKIAKRLAKVCMMVLVLSCSLGSITQAEETISFTAVSSIKIGEELAGKIQYQNASEGMTYNRIIEGRWRKFLVNGKRWSNAGISIKRKYKSYFPAE